MFEFYRVHTLSWFKEQISNQNNYASTDDQHKISLELERAKIWTKYIVWVTQWHDIAIFYKYKIYNM